MKRSWLLLFVLFFLVGFCGSIPAMANETLMFPVETSADDAEEGDDGPGVMDIDSSDLELAWDHDDPNRAQTIGVRFANVSIPPEAIIENAELRVYTAGSTGNDVSFYRMLIDWPDVCTWNILGGDGVTPDDVEAASTAADVLVGPKSGNYHFLDVNASLQDWLSGNSNYGWGIINSGTDGWDVATSENSVQELRPRLTVFYTLPGDLDKNGIVSTGMMSMSSGRTTDSRLKSVRTAI